MEILLTVEGKQFGRGRSLFPTYTLPGPTDSGSGVTLGRLIEHVVAREVDAYNQRRAERTLIHALTAADIAAGAEAGKIAMGGRDAEGTESEPSVDAGAATVTALRAFEDGHFFVFVDDEQQQDLDAIVPLRRHSTLTFLRLVALAGG